MKTETISDYMAGRIGDVYYGKCGSYGVIPFGVIDVIDDDDAHRRYRLKATAHIDLAIPWPERGKFDHFEREVEDTMTTPDSDVVMERIKLLRKVYAGDIEVTTDGNHSLV